MNLSDTDIQNFQEIYKMEFGRNISREEALEKGTKLLQLVSIIYKPMTHAEYKGVQKRRRELGLETFDETLQ